MMYVFPITIPASTPSSSPVVETMQLVKGTIRSVQVQVPDGVFGLAHIGINLGLYQIYPSNSEATFATSGETIDWTEDYLLDQEPFVLTAYGWNDDVVNDHTITLRFDVAPAVMQTDLAQEIATLLATAGVQ